MNAAAVWQKGSHGRLVFSGRLTAGTGLGAGEAEDGHAAREFPE